MNQRLVSVCLPVLNAGDFFAARLKSVFEQTYGNWELVAVDNYSDDGTWEALTAAAARDSRIRIRRAERQGMYANWNNTLADAKGEYVYIATADDTMSPTCLEKLVEVVQAANKPCIAQCGLTLIDEHDDPFPGAKQWPANTEWHSAFAQRFEHRHVRLAPFDGALVMLFGTSITSITQALFPREAFQKVGGFPVQFGSAGDLAWEMLLGFFYDVHYIPDRLATWRMYSEQATAKQGDGYYSRNIAIGEWVLERLAVLAPEMHARARRIGLNDYRRFAEIRHAFATDRRSSRLKAMTALSRSCPRFYLSYLTARLGMTRKFSADAVTTCRLLRLESFLKQAIGGAYATERSIVGS